MIANCVQIMKVSNYNMALESKVKVKYKKLSTARNGNSFFSFFIEGLYTRLIAY